MLPQQGQSQSVCRERASVRVAGQSDQIVPATIFGHNLELFDRTAENLLSDRLANPLFAGPPHPDTGIAFGWDPVTTNFSGVYYQHVAGEGLMGSAAQMIENSSGKSERGILQCKRWIRKGERLRISLWARVQHMPVTVQVGLRGASLWSTPYNISDIYVDSPVFKEYSVEINVPENDDNAVFFCFLASRGRVFIDQMHLRPFEEEFLRADVMGALGNFKIPVLRFPGGCITTCYHWQLGIGPRHVRPTLSDPVFKRQIRYEFGTDEYLRFCLQWGIIPHITVNTGAATIAEAGEWASYCAEWYRRENVPAPKMYWQIGCEPYGHWSRDHMTGEMFAKLVAGMAPLIRRAYPEAIILAIGQADADSFYEGESKRPWRGPLLDLAAGLIDGIVMQHYSIIPADESDPVVVNARIFAEAEWMASVPREALAELDRRGLDLIVGYSEWNLWMQASHFNPEGFIEPMDIQHALFAATMFHHFARLAPRFSIANYYHIIAGMGLFEVVRDKVRLSLVGNVFKLYRDAFPSRLLLVDVESSFIGPETKAIEALAVSNEQAEWLFLVNRSLDLEIEVYLEGVEVSDVGVIYSGLAPQDLDCQEREIRASGDKLVIPPLAIVRIPIKSQGF